MAKEKAIDHISHDKKVEMDKLVNTVWGITHKIETLTKDMEIIIDRLYQMEVEVNDGYSNMT